MNRRERRKVEKKLGLLKHKNSLSPSKRIKYIQDNFKGGKNRENEMKEERKRQENEEKDRQTSADIASLATTLMIKNGLSWIEALEAAKKELESSQAET